MTAKSIDTIDTNAREGTPTFIYHLLDKFRRISKFNSFYVHKAEFFSLRVGQLLEIRRGRRVLRRFHTTSA
jgi:hypothetical protein